MTKFWKEITDLVLLKTTTFFKKESLKITLILSASYQRMSLLFSTV